MLSVEDGLFLLGVIEQKAAKGLIKTANDIRALVEAKVGQKVSDDYLWDLLNRNGWKKKMPRPHHPKEISLHSRSLKKLPDSLASLRWPVDNVSTTKPVVVFFEDEGRFGRIRREMYCWVKKDMVPSVAKQMIREYIYAYSAIAPQTGDCFSMITPCCNTEAMTLFYPS